MTASSPHLHEGARSPWFAVPEDLGAAVGARLGAILPALASLYLFLAAGHILFSPGSLSRIDGGAAYFAGLLCFLAWTQLRRKRISLSAMHPLAVSVCAITLAHGYYVLPAARPSSPVAIAFLVLAATGASLYSIGWQSVVIAFTIAGWLAISLPVLSASTLSYWLLVLLVTAALAIVNVKYRVCKVSHCELIPSSAGHGEKAFRPEYLERAIEGTSDGLWYWELKTDVFHFSNAWASLLGFEPQELKARPDEWMSRVHPGYIARLRSELAEHLHGQAPQFRNEHRIRRKDGSYLWVLARGTVIRDEYGEPAVLAGSHSDISPLIEAEKRLLTDAFTDGLTGLPNRNFLMGHLQLAVEEKLSRGSAAPLFAVLFLDLDRFKFINDTMGHQVGDELLIAVASRLKNCARPDDVVSRFGGDEFVVLLRNLRDAEEAVQVATRMQKALCAPFQLGARTIQSGGSIGIALSSEGFKECDDILRYGDLAMYEAKRNKIDKVQVFHPGMVDTSKDDSALRGDLSSAIERGQLLLHYQPLIQLTTGKIVGAEALIRWRRSPEQILYPADFLPLAEKSGLIHDIGDWAIRTACAQNASWQRSGLPPMRMAVNVSASQLQQRDFSQRVSAILADTKLDPSWLEFELTESTLLRGLDASPATLKALSDSGIRTSLDDFGAGNVSLSSLNKLPFHTLKLDRGFISDVATDRRAAAVARGLISLAHDLDVNVVAEGVEQDAQYRFLSHEHCDNAQGYFTGRPVPGDELFDLLRTGRRATGTPSIEQLEADLARLDAAHKPAIVSPPSSALRWAAERKARR